MLSQETSEVKIPVSGGPVSAVFHQPYRDSGVVVFAHGSGSSRKSPRNVYVAEFLAESGFGYLLLDLLTEQEADSYENVFDIDLLAERLCVAVSWVKEHLKEPGSPIAFFGASTGSAAALVAAARLGDTVQAVVSRGGRPDLAGEALGSVRCPSLFIVGSLDATVLELNQEAITLLPETTVSELATVEGATHLFEEPGTLHEAARMARSWFEMHVSAHRLQVPTRS